MSKDQGRKLKWGETQFTSMTREELLQHVHRLFITTTRLYSVVNMTRHTERMMRGELSSYWGPRGVGGAAMEMADQVFAMTNAGLDPDIHEPRSGIIYYRYAEDLLFDTTTHEMVGSGWRICVPCGVLMGSKTVPDDDPCIHCKQPTRKLEWKDLDPLSPEEEARLDPH